MAISRAEQLTFCERCIHRKMDLRQGLLCGISQQKADFDPICNNFEQDEKIEQKPKWVEAPVQPPQWMTTDPIQPIRKEEVHQYESQQRFDLAIAGGIVAAILGAALWAAITIITDYQIGYMAIGLGVLIGFAIQFFGAGVDKKFGILGGVLALIACLLGNFWVLLGYYAINEGSSLYAVLFMVDWPRIPTIMIESSAPIDLLFYAIAVAAGYKYAFRSYSLLEQKNFDQQGIEPVPAHARWRIPVLLAGIFIILLGASLTTQSFSGPKNFTYDDGNTQSSGEMIDGKMEGNWVFYWPSGVMSQSGTFKNNKAHGRWEWFDEKGRLTAKAYYDRGNEHGLWTTFYPGSNISDTGRYVNGRKSGEWVAFFDKGNIKAKGKFELDQRQGEWLLFYEAGQLKMRMNYKNDILHGLYESYHPNGLLAERFLIENGFPVDFQQQYAGEGTPLILAGNGLYRSLMDDPIINGSGEVAEGKIVGSWEHFSSFIGQRIIGYYDGQEFIITSVTLPNNKVMIKEGNGYLKAYQSDGKKIEFEGQVENGKRVGQWTFYHPNGKVREEVFYKAGKIEGESTEYSDEGEILVLMNYKDGLAHGKSSWFFDFGDLSAEVNFVEGKKEGLQHFYDERGIHIRDERYKNGEFVEAIIID